MVERVQLERQQERAHSRERVRRNKPPGEGVVTGLPPDVTEVERLRTMPRDQRVSAMRALQRVHGNRHVQRLLAPNLGAHDHDAVPRVAGSPAQPADIRVSAPGDRAERVASRIADRVGGVKNSQPPRAADGGMRRTTSSERPTRAPGIVRRVVRSAGRRLDARTAKTLGTQLGWDLADVRVHTDRRAAVSAAAIDARAYTVGADIAFAAGEYAPDTARGRHLLVHELAHVAQDTTGAVGAPAVVHRSPREETDSQRRAPTQRERAFSELVLNYAMETGNDQLLRRLGVAEDVIETAREGKGILGRWGQMRRRGRPQSRPGGGVSLGVDALLGAGEVAIEIARARERRARDQAYIDLVEGAIKLGVEVYPVAVRNAPAVFIIHPEQQRQARIEARERFASSLREEISRLSGGGLASRRNREAFQSFLEFPVKAEISDLRAGRDVEPNVLRRDPQVLYRFLPVPGGTAERVLEAQQD